ARPSVQNVHLSDSVLGDALGYGAGANGRQSKSEYRGPRGERADIAAVLKGAPLKRIIESDSALKQQVADATKALQEEEQADQAEETLARASKATLERKFRSCVSVWAERTRSICSISSV